ncbi:hypothetical protein BZA77DRAFT_295208 [Pyronema omphalodes]|nr:hypothetical protein BZA77DRAFT_295715 [Pyronema omphalodes]KAI5814346.1 hypothetical protein BZA77DRAFT_295208 [Pyronema omphalodes]
MFQATPMDPTSIDTRRQDEVTDKPWPELSFMRTPDEGTRYRSDNNYSYSYLSPPMEYDAYCSGASEYSYRNPQPPSENNRGYSYNPQPPSPTPAASPFPPHSQPKSTSDRNTQSYPPYPLFHHNPEPQHHKHHYQPPYLDPPYPHRNPRHPIRIITTLPYYIDTLGRLYTPLSPTGAFTHHWPPGFFTAFLSSISNLSGRCRTLLHHLGGSEDDTVAAVKAGGCGEDREVVFPGSEAEIGFWV